MQTQQYSTTLLRNLTEEHKQAWQALWKRSARGHLFNTPGFFEAWLDAFRIKEYVIIFCYRDGTLCAVLPLVKGKVFGIPSFVSVGSAGNYADHSSLLIEEHMAAEIISALFETALGLGNIYVAEISAAVAGLLERTSSPSFIPEVSVLRNTSLAQETDTLQYMPSRQKRELKRHLRQQAPHLDFRVAGADALETVRAIEQESYRPDYHMDFFSKAQSVRFVESIARHLPDSLKIGILSYQGWPIATNLGFLWGQTFYGYHMAYREEFRRIGPGKIVMYFLLQWLQQNGCTAVDFSRGESDLKQQFSQKPYSQYDAYLTRHWGVFIWWRLCFYVWWQLRRLSAWMRDWMHRKKSPFLFLCLRYLQKREFLQRIQSGRTA